MDVAPKPAEQYKGIYLINGWVALCWLSPYQSISADLSCPLFN